MKRLGGNVSRGLLIAGPPVCGKTTLLRDLARQLSEKHVKVCVIDERGELAAVSGGRLGVDLGPCADVLNGYPKTAGMEIALRCLSPEVIICDEIGENEVKAVTDCADCGVDTVAADTSSDVKVIGEAELLNGTANENFDEFFSTARVQLETLRASSLEILNSITMNADVDGKLKETAATEASEIAQRFEQESNIENLIKAKGFAECVAVIGDDGIKVMVQSTGLLPAEAAQIADIVTSETGKDLSNVRIVEVK